MPTATWKVAVEVRQCPLGSGARGGGPAVPTGIWSSQWRSGCAHWDLDCEEEAAGEEVEEENSSDKIIITLTSGRWGITDVLPATRNDLNVKK